MKESANILLNETMRYVLTFYHDYFYHWIYCHSTIFVSFLIPFSGHRRGDRGTSDEKDTSRWPGERFFALIDASGFTWEPILFPQFPSSWSLSLFVFQLVAVILKCLIGIVGNELQISEHCLQGRSWNYIIGRVKILNIIYY